MGEPIRGAWLAANANAYDMAGALKWGTGNNPVHEVYGEGPPLRTTGREPGPDSPTSQLSTIPPLIENPDIYGYTMEDVAVLESFHGMPPPVGTETDEFRGQNATGLPDYGVIATDPEATEFRLSPELAAPLWSGIKLGSFPTESVGEGWDNKLSGKVLGARTSDPSQYERQTSMQQVNPAAGRNNDAAVLRATDDPRNKIMTRLTGMKIKPWSTGERLQDMFPFQQDTIVRPFGYRTAATGDPSRMATNEMYVVDPIERVPPPDPYLGDQETDVDDGYGYTTEDVAY